jgi:hypothetical protein
MTRRTNSRIAGSAFLLYIGVYVIEITLFGAASAGDEPVARLAAMAANARMLRIDLVLGLLTCFFAVTLGVTLWALTRSEDRELAMLGLVCRAGEGLIGAAPIAATFGLLAVATADGAAAPDASATTLASFVMEAHRWNWLIAAAFFAVGSTAFCWLLLRGRMIPAALAWLGVAASLLLIVGVPLQLAGFIRPPFADFMWAPMAAFEIALALWLLTKGAALPRRAGGMMRTRPAAAGP